MIAISYLMKRKIKKIFLEIISYTKILFNEIANYQDFAKLKGRTRQRRIRYQKQDSSHEPSEVFYEEIYDFLNNDKGERYPKKLEQEIDKSDMNLKKTLNTKKHVFSKKLKLESNKTQKFKAVAKYLMFENPEDKNSYLLTQRTYNTLDDLGVD